jgi:putative toxin-antitoxin system antitoxin component (TIGR02293 family)
MAGAAYAGFMATAPHKAARLPGRALGLKARSSVDLIQQLERGLSFHALQALETHSGITVGRIATIIGIPERTLARRRTSGRLTADESERLLRVSGVYEKAVDLFEGDEAAARSWLTSPKPALAGETPLAYSRTELGAREVENLIGRLEHGVYS